MKQMRIRELYDLTHTLAQDYLSEFTYPWEALRGIPNMIREIGKKLPPEYKEISPNIWIHEDAVIAKTAHIGAPCIIGAKTEVRHCAFIRGSALIGDGCVIGNSVENKNAIIFDSVQVPHFNYVGDSILGYRSHLGAGAVTSNVKADKTLVVIHAENGDIRTEQKKVGSMVGDFVEVGCNSVLNPGSVIGRNTTVYPLSFIRGVIPANSICKTGGIVVPKNDITG